MSSPRKGVCFTVAVPENSKLNNAKDDAVDILRVPFCCSSSCRRNPFKGRVTREDAL